MTVAPPRRTLPWSVAWLGMVLAGIAACGAVAAHRLSHVSTTAGPGARLLLTVALTVAGTLQLEFRSRDDVNAIDVFDVVLAPLLLAAPGGVAVLIVAVAKAASQRIRHVQPAKAGFNVAQWAAATAVGSAIFAAVRSDRSFSGRTVGGLVLALVAAAVVNHVAVTVVITLAQRRPLRDVTRGFVPVMLRTWVVGGTVNIAVGILLAASWTSFPAAAVLFLAPLVALHRSSVAQAEARAQSAFLDGIHRATRTLGAAATPSAVIPAFLEDVRRCLGCETAELILGAGPNTTSWSTAGGSDTPADHVDQSDLTSALLEHGGSVRVGSGSGDNRLRTLLTQAAHSSAVVVPVGAGHGESGILCAYDRQGFGQFDEHHIVVLEAMASELDSALRRGRLFDEVNTEQQKLADILDGTSDGIASLDIDGAVTSWNAGFVHLSGYDLADVVEQGIDVLAAVDSEGVPLRLAGWRNRDAWPADLAIQRADGGRRWLSCSYSTSPAGDRLVIIARDVTEARELAAAEAALRNAEQRAVRADRQVKASRAEVARLNEREMIQRGVVHELQKAVFPAPPEIDDTELGVFYVCADDTAPTGGDLYDWLALPNGDLHLAVVDIVGHGVAATKEALAVIHALRLLALQDIGLEHVIARADALLSVPYPDLQATVVVARYRPTTGEVTIAGGGHPPAVHICRGATTELVTAPGVPLGWPGSGTHDLGRALLAPGESLILYTDGVIEAGRDIVAGLAGLERIAAQGADRRAPDLARELVEQALSGGGRRDDALALVLRRSTGDDGGAGHGGAVTGTGVVDSVHGLPASPFGH